MTDLENALFNEEHNRMNIRDAQRRDVETAHQTLKSMLNMVHESMAEHELGIKYRDRVSKKIQRRYGIPPDSEFQLIWHILEKFCNKQINHEQTI